ncbi:diacylglycerol kinase [Alkalihalobacillus pseudalcaliphilus]|nr:diacylglycerol kinase family protein [Alkalihalobacillus pseudalcaliphilus]KMK76655.1 diacylglycerol kinase [Alkalihalobacillus pseudalcaliphilus]
MALQDRNKRGFRRLLRSFDFAYQGLKHVIKHEQNMQVHAIVALLTVAMAAWLSFSLTSWMILLLVIAGMFSMEIMNTAVERTVDLITNDFHPLAKRAKDIAASAVLVYTLFSIVIGALLFIPPILEKFHIL